MSYETGHGGGKIMTTLDELATLIHGRVSIPQDYLGGQSARIFGDAIASILSLRVSLQEAEYYLAIILGAVHDDGGEYQTKHGTASAVLNAQVKIDAFKVADHWLGEILACLHDDEGDYLDQHGMEMATRDAISIHAETIKERDRLKLAYRLLNELLACLYDDGGHYLGRYGMEKATRDAIVAHDRKIKALDALRDESEVYRGTLLRIAQNWAQPARDLALLALAAEDNRKLNQRGNP